MKTDAFGINHRPHCRRPHWRIATAHHGINSSHIQQCRNCGITWRPGEPSTTPQPTRGYTEKATTS